MTAKLRALSYLPQGHKREAAFDQIILRHDERRIRRRLLTLAGGDEVLVDFPEPVTLEGSSALLLEDGRQVEIVAADEPLYEVRGRNTEHLMQLCWHLGNRHLKTEIRGDTLLILRDHVIRDMLLGLGAKVRETSEPFQPLEGAYHQHGEHALLNR